MKIIENVPINCKLEIGLKVAFAIYQVQYCSPVRTEDEPGEYIVYLTGSRTTHEPSSAAAVYSNLGSSTPAWPETSETWRFGSAKLTGTTHLLPKV